MLSQLMIINSIAIYWSRRFEVKSNCANKWQRGMQIVLSVQKGPNKILLLNRFLSNEKTTRIRWTNTHGAAQWKTTCRVSVIKFSCFGRSWVMAHGIETLVHCTSKIDIFVEQNHGHLKILCTEPKRYQKVYIDKRRFCEKGQRAVWDPVFVLFNYLYL